MKGKQLFILLVLAALAAGGWYYLSQDSLSRSSRKARAEGKILDFPINDVEHIKIKSSEGELNVVKKGDTWVVPERADYPANFEQVSGFIRKLWELKTVQDVGKVGKSQLPRLELEEPGKGEKTATVVELIGANDKTLASILLGKKFSRKSEGGGNEMGMPAFAIGRYVKPAGGEKVSLVNESFDDVEPSPAKWLAKDFVKVDPAKSISVTGQTDAQKWTITRESATGEWKLADAKPDEKVDANKNFSLGSIFSSPNFDDVLAPTAKPEETGLDKPTMAKIETFDGFTYELKIGKPNGKDTPVTVAVSADLPKERTPGKDEKPEDKTKLDDEFKAKQKRLEEKLANEQKFAGRVYLVPQSSVEPLLKDRAALLPDKPAEPAPAAPGAAVPGGPLPVPVPGAPTPVPGVPAPAPGAPAPAPATPTPPEGAKPAPEPAAKPAPEPPPAKPAPEPAAKPAPEPPAKPAPEPPPAPALTPESPAKPAPAPDPAAKPAPDAPAKPAPDSSATPSAPPAKPAPASDPAPGPTPEPPTKP